MKDIFTGKFIVGLSSMILLLLIFEIYSIGKDK